MLIRNGKISRWADEKGNQWRGTLRHSTLGYFLFTFSTSSYLSTCWAENTGDYAVLNFENVIAQTHYPLKLGYGHIWAQQDLTGEPQKNIRNH